MTGQFSFNTGFNPSIMPDKSLLAGTLPAGSWTPADLGNIFNQPVMPMANPSLQNIFSPAIIDRATQNMFMEYFMKSLETINAPNPMFLDMMSMLNMGNNPTQSYFDEDTSNFSYDSEALKDKWSSKKPHLSDGFYNKLVEMCKRLGCDPDKLMAIMNSESGLNPQAVNSQGGATGLIQFMPKTAAGLGTTTDALKKMSAEEQLVYVEKYLQNTKKSAGYNKDDKIGAGTLYALIYLPARAGRNELTRKGEKYYDFAGNSSLDIDKDGAITKADLEKRVQSFMA